MDAIPPARHDLLRGRYYFGSVQTTRGCPLSCSFCSVTATLSVVLVANLSLRSNHLLDRRIYASRVQSPNLGDAPFSFAGGRTAISLQ